MSLEPIRSGSTSTTSAPTSCTAEAISRRAHSGSLDRDRALELLEAAIASELSGSD